MDTFRISICAEPPLAGVAVSLASDLPPNAGGLSSGILGLFQPPISIGWLLGGHSSASLAGLGDFLLTGDLLRPLARSPLQLVPLLTIITGSILLATGCRPPVSDSLLWERDPPSSTSTRTGRASMGR